MKFSSSTQLVVETVAVKDKSGKTIEGLTAKDFAVTEDGKPQTIEFCEFQKLHDTPSPAPRAASSAPPAVPEAVASGDAHPDRARNAGRHPYRDRRLIALYFDMTAMPLPDQLRALARRRSSCKTQMARPDLMALMTYRRRRRAGAARISPTIATTAGQTHRKLIVGKAKALTPTDDDDSDRRYRRRLRPGYGEFNIFNTDRQLAALQTAVKMLGTLNEKKSLVYFASGLRLNGVDNQAQLQCDHQLRHPRQRFVLPDRRARPGGAGAAGRRHAGLAGRRRHVLRRLGAGHMTASSARRTRCTRSAPTPAARRCSITTISPRASCRRSRPSPATTSSGYYTTNTALDGKFRRIKITLQRTLTAKLDLPRRAITPAKSSRSSPRPTRSGSSKMR